MKRVFVFLSVLAIAIAAIGAEKKNAKEGAADKKNGSQAAGDKKAADIDLTGVWRGYVVEGKGEQPNRGSVHLELTIKDNQIVAQRLDGEGGPLGQGTFTITTERFYLLDATEARKHGKPRVYPGICKFGPDLMRWCVATPGANRPTDFETKDKQFLLILKRQRK